MNITEIDKLSNGSAVECVDGVIDTIKLPTEQTDKDREKGNHRQSVLIRQGNQKLLVIFVKAEQHILTKEEGQAISLTANNGRGLLLSVWDKGRALYVYPEASVRVGAPETKSPPKTQVTITAAQQGGEELSLDKVINTAKTRFKKYFPDQPEDPAAVVGIAQMILNLAMIYSDDGQLPEVVTKAEPAHGPASTPLQPEDSKEEMPTSVLIERVAKGSLMHSKIKNKPAQLKAFDDLWDELSTRVDFKANQEDEFAWESCAQCIAVMSVDKMDALAEGIIESVKEKWYDMTAPMRAADKSFSLARHIVANAEQFSADIKAEL